MCRYSSSPRDGGTTAETLTDDLLLEIISRVPSRHHWRCKCVCKHWLGLARKLPQSLAGFFCTGTSKKRFQESALQFFKVSGTRGWPSFNFLPQAANRSPRLPQRSRIVPLLWRPRLRPGRRWVSVCHL
ncbi:hypothetical protein QYE76_036162 [Lolium multiflorum]|uniref:F-box domain-containing protein n=1 Tax=Lolium multiflorum TaxID=4521 RepID=A0AAD8R332_LOLMU|nr:hypothetical protein QYE76_036162 [Lolium multiflorum]